MWTKSVKIKNAPKQLAYISQLDARNVDMAEFYVEEAFSNILSFAR